MTGTFGGALEARKIPAGEKRLVGEVRGEVEKDGRVLILKRIHVHYVLKVAPDMREAAERAHRVHADACPVARSIRAAIAISTDLEMVDA